ncbi:MAG: formate dehydrogenase accessory sulfurtransferase FdhD [Deltaproteobacteria bacterium]|nr:formate dehydrogenase accessory sulfurtransferase FdhD [Deltaproteobacteria bacterium]
MDNNKTCKTYDITRYQNNVISREKQDFVLEEPLLITIEDTPYSTLIRTPGNETELAAGLCLSEGIIQSHSDIASIDFCINSDKNRITVKLADKNKKEIRKRLEKKRFINQLSGEISSEKMINDLTQNINIADHKFNITPQQINIILEKFFNRQKYYAKTRGTHAVALFNSRLNIISQGEDVGRHNAMDKAIGFLLINNKMADIRLAALSSRISFEIIQKTAQAKIPILISLSNPTSMAVEIALKLNMTIINMDKKTDGFIVSCGDKRVKQNKR